MTDDKIDLSTAKMTDDVRSLYTDMAKVAKDDLMASWDLREQIHSLCIEAAKKHKAKINSSRATTDGGDD